MSFLPAAVLLFCILDIDFFPTADEWPFHWWKACDGPSMYDMNQIQNQKLEIILLYIINAIDFQKHIGESLTRWGWKIFRMVVAQWYWATDWKGHVVKSINPTQADTTESLNRF